MILWIARMLFQELSSPYNGTSTTGLVESQFHSQYEAAAMVLSRKDRSLNLGFCGGAHRSCYQCLAHWNFYFWAMHALLSKAFPFSMKLELTTLWSLDSDPLPQLRSHATHHPPKSDPYLDPQTQQGWAHPANAWDSAACRASHSQNTAIPWPPAQGVCVVVLCGAVWCHLCRSSRRYHRQRWLSLASSVEPNQHCALTIASLFIA